MPITQPRAKSRLSPPSESKELPTRQQSRERTSRKKFEHSLNSPEILILFIISIAIIVFIFSSVAPESIANIPLPQTYGVLLLVVGAAMFSGFRLFTTSYVSSAIGIFVALLLFLRLNFIAISLPVVVALGLIISLTTISITLLKRR